MAAARDRAGLSPDGAATSSLIACRDVEGRWLRKLDRGPGGRDFPCRLVAWEETPDDFVPWPLEDVTPLAEHPDALTREEFQRG